MKLVHKIVLGNSLSIILIALVTVVSYQKFELVLAKLYFVEIADSLDASFLKMRILEKNYFLYRDNSALSELKKQLKQAFHAVDLMSTRIVLAVGSNNFKKLKLILKKYKQEIGKIGKIDQNTAQMKKSIRKTGRELRLFSENIIRLERKKVNEIILDSRKKLFYFVSAVILLAILSTYLFFSKMFKSIRQIEKTANSISEGKFLKIEGKIPKNELGSCMAAINSMCEELETGLDQLIQSKKLVSLGILTAGVAHELGNPLNNISMVAQTYLELYEQLPREDRLDYMKTVLEESERIKKIVQNLLDFSRAKQTNFKIADINSVIRKSIKLVQNMLHVSGIEHNLDLEKKLPSVFIDVDKILEVLVNLLTNAVHAMSSGGMLFIRTNFQKIKNTIVIEITDNGKGIAPEFLAHIFDPFFSTKHTRGTGLGLSISYGIIKKHNGRISVESKVGVGTTFFIKLPAYMAKEDTDERTQNHGN